MYFSYFQGKWGGGKEDIVLCSESNLENFTVTFDKALWLKLNV